MTHLTDVAATYCDIIHDTNRRHVESPPTSPRNGSASSISPAG
jgi:hypothetical protein